MENIAQELTAKIGGPVRTGEPLSRYTSFKIGGPADLYVEPETTAELVAVLTVLRQKGIPWFILGSGTNLLVNDRGYRGAVLRLGGDFCRTAYDGPVVEAGAAVKLAVLARDAGRRGLAGLEFAAGIPGSVGGALVMNAGAHGGAVSDCLLEAVVLDRDLELHRLAHDALGLSYRKSSLPPESVVCSVKLGLKPGNKEALEEKSREYLAFRRDRQPRQPNAGSIFKNPPSDAAGRLIEAAGLKGHRSGGAKISEVHANFIVNCGEATAEDVLSLIETAKASVVKQFGVTLELEVRLLGY
ncbi:MAG: UDP-N-acetylmuramate dehydrogenase [Bacillota bacterium]|nr:UDP-N-acetylmuramate dehydrogenase [Bacillota bacterium]MDW7684015.1 UDP-N-acetylmuramate dehydrogenase [Bacillota bacterium]